MTETATPSAVLFGPARRVVRSDKPLHLLADASVSLSLCDGSVLSDGLDLVWTVSKNGGTSQSQLQSSSHLPCVFDLMPYSLEGGNTYVIRLSIGDVRVFLRASVDQCVRGAIRYRCDPEGTGPFEQAVAAGSQVTNKAGCHSQLRPRRPLRIALRANASANLHYRWSCKTVR